MPFDRLIATVDEWAGRRGRGDVFAQTGPTPLIPRHIEWARSLEPDAFRDKIDAARVVVGHAGMGTIISALQAGKPVIVLPRLGSLRETRNDHQVATARYWGEHASVRAAMDESALIRELDRADDLGTQPKIMPTASDEMIHALRSFISADARVAG
ncbi:MAG: glycosyltransferase [Phycisphaerales bacterium]